MRLAYVTWRNRSRLREYSGGNVAREYLIAKVAELAGADEVVGIAVEDLDSGILAGAGRLLSSLGTIGRIRVEEFRRRLGRLDALGEAALAAGDRGDAEGAHRVEGGSLDNRGIQAWRQQARLRWHREASRRPRLERLSVIGAWYQRGEDPGDRGCRIHRLPPCG